MLKGCLLTSLHPLFTSEEYIKPDGLTGGWVSEDNESFWYFSDSGEDYFRLVVTEKDSSFVQGPDSTGTYSVSTDTSEFKAVFGVIANELYLDILVVPNASEDKGSLRNTQLAFTHTFYKFKLKGTEAELYPADFKWIEDNLKKKKIKIKHEKLENDNLLLTASTKELQQFVKKYSSKGLFPKPLTLYRKKD